MVPDSLVLCTEQMQASLKRCLGGILAATLSNDTWLRARVSVKKGGFGIRDPVLHSPAAFVELHHQHRSPLPQLWPSHRATCEPDVASSGSRCQATFHSVAAAPGRTCPQRINIFVQPVRRPHSGCKALELGLGLYHFRLGTLPSARHCSTASASASSSSQKGTRCSCAATSWTHVGDQWRCAFATAAGPRLLRSSTPSWKQACTRRQKKQAPKQTRPQRGRQVPSQRYPHHSGGLRRPHLRLERLHSNNGHMDFPTTQLHSSLHFQ